MKKEAESEAILELKDFTPEELARAESVEEHFKDPLGIKEDSRENNRDEEE